jgi:hypothetical protein
MTFLQLCQRVRQECGIAGTGPTTVVGQTGELGRVVSWTATAYDLICAKHVNWKFLRSSFSVNSVASQEAYLPTTCTDTEIAAAIGSATVGAFGSWIDDSFWIYKNSEGIATRREFYFYDYENFRYLYQIRPPNPGSPVYFTFRPRDNAILLGPKPDAVYVMAGEYYRIAPPLAADSDTPLFPARFHMAIVWLAQHLYAGYEEDGGVWTDSQTNFGQLYFPLMVDQLPRLLMARPLI